MATTLLLDTDIVAYRFAASAQKTFKWPNGSTSLTVDDFESIKGPVEEYVERLRADLKATDVVVCLSCPSSENWRRDFLPSYKANRPSEKPVWLQAVKDHLAAIYPSYARPRLEADDIMGILATHPKLYPGKKIIVSEDKDMKGVPARLYNPRTMQKTVVSESDADHWHMLQTLMGDPVDGYSGCPGIGKVKAAAALAYERADTLGSPFGRTQWAKVVGTYESAGLTEEDALVQARVARICRASDYDFANKRVIPWSPPSDTSRKA